MGFSGVFRGSTGCFDPGFQFLALLCIPLLFIPKLFFFKNWADRPIFDPQSAVPEGYFQGVWHCFGRGKTPGRRYNNHSQGKIGENPGKKRQKFQKTSECQKNRRGLTDGWEVNCMPGALD